MPLPREEVVAGLQDELVRFEKLVRSVDEAEWGAPTRCEGWTVADVSAHLIGTMVDIGAGRLEGLGTPEVTEREVQERRGRSPAELAEELQHATRTTAELAVAFDDESWRGPAPGGFDLTLGEGVEALWYDAYVHADDIRSALGRPSEQGPGLRASVSHAADLLTRQGWGPATLTLDGLEEFPVSGGGGARVSGDPLSFVLAATGRADPAPLGLDETVNLYR